MSTRHENGQQLFLASPAGAEADLDAVGVFADVRHRHMSEMAGNERVIVRDTNESETKCVAAIPEALRPDLLVSAPIFVADIPFNTFGRDNFHPCSDLRLDCCRFVGRQHLIPNGVLRLNGVTGKRD